MYIHVHFRCLNFDVMGGGQALPPYSDPVSLPILWPRSEGSFAFSQSHESASKNGGDYPCTAARYPCRHYGRLLSLVQSSGKQLWIHMYLIYFVT